MMRPRTCSSISLKWLSVVVVAMCLSVCTITSADTLSSPIESIRYHVEQPFRMNMSSTREIAILVTFDKNAIPVKGADVISVTFKTSTISPQWNILSLDASDVRVSVPRKHLESTGYRIMAKARLHANYIGHAILQPTQVEFLDGITKKTTVVGLSKDNHKLPVTIVQFEGIWGTIFIISVSLVILTSYINLGALLDEENMKQVVKKPKTLILGFLISVFVMPSVSWIVGIWLFNDQPLYRIGSFIFACGPAASASTLWTVMLNSDKELSVGLQVVSTVGALITMPTMLYLMERSLKLDQELYHHIKVPYSRLVQTLLALLIALIVGWRLVGTSKKAQQISRRIFRPLIFSVLIYIIVFSSILYWHIYQMFDWNITLGSVIISMATYVISGILGHLINCDLDRGVAISITSAYKNSGIAFAVLLVAFDAPDTYIAYVPCLTQVVTTSLALYLTYIILSLVNFLRRRGQPEVIQAVDCESAPQRKGSLRGADPDASDKPARDDDENDEFIAMNVTDIEPESLPVNRKPSETNEANKSIDEQVAVKVIATDKTED